MTGEFSSTTSKNMGAEGDEQRSRIPNLAAALRGLKFLDVGHE
jgi:hypothetical protein